MPQNRADNELCGLTVAELARWYRERRCSPVEVTDAYLRRIETFDGTLGAYISVTHKPARAAAARSERRFLSDSPAGPVDGIPFGVKDLFDTAGITTTGGSRQFIDRVPTRDATVIARLLAGGAVLLGKHSMFEFASGMPSADVPFPAARNPWDLSRIPGGSSSGSASAVSARLCSAAFGSDSGGSIRGPASYCGVVGVKPSAGLVSRAGVLPLSWTLDAVGPISRTVEDAAILLQVVAGYDLADPQSRRGAVPDYRAALATSVAGRRIGVPLSLVAAAPDIDTETMALYQSALADLELIGGRLEEVRLPESEHANAVVQTLITSEALAYHYWRATEVPELFGSVFYGRLLQGALLSAEDYITAQRGRSLITRAMHELMESVELIAMPTTPHPATSFDSAASVSVWDATNFTRLFNITGQPAVTVPCGFTPKGLPVGLQIAGRVGDDKIVLASARAYEQRHGWHAVRPSWHSAGSSS